MPLAVMLVVDAPPFMENKPLVIVDDACERNPRVNVCVWLHVFAVVVPNSILNRPVVELYASG